MDQQSQPAQPTRHLREIATAKYATVKILSFGRETGRRLELGMTGSTPEKIEEIVVDQFINIADRLGSEFFLNTPAVALEQFAVMALNRNDDTAGMLKSLINSFMVAYLTPETSERALQTLISLESLRAEVAAGRPSIAKAVSPLLKAYLVGDSIVAAFDPAGAIKVLCAFNGEPLSDYALDDVTLICDVLLDNRTVFNTGEDSLRDRMARLTEPAYLCGWD